ncbi:hypothetical protein [Brenneria goodwinii]|uniref:hypothetical protein n=1 Tax=Brenneria goodwinii TaxID=1109412 RepID=UPI0036EC66F1
MYRKFVFFVFVYTLFGFKLSILGDTGDEIDGNILSSIRIDDVIIVLFLFVYLVSGGQLLFFIRKKTVIWFLVYILVCMFSSFYNSITGDVSLLSSLLFSLRPFEYFLYIALGYELARLSINPDNSLKIYVFYCLVLIIGQTFGVIGGISNFSFNRAIANTGGPWELAAVSAFLTMYFILNRKLINGLLSTIILILTQSRITLVGTAIVLLFRNYRQIFFIFRKSTAIVGSGVILIFCVSYFGVSLVSSKNDISSTTTGVAVRFESFSSNDTISGIESILSNTQAAQNRQDYFNKTYGESLDNILSTSGDGDASAFIRFTRWVTLIKTACSDTMSFLIGLGPSYAGKAVDGNYVRIFIETGIIGIFTYIIFLFSFFKHVKDKLLINYIIILVVTALFIDIFVTFKAMFLFWTFYGYHLYMKKLSKNG